MGIHDGHRQRMRERFLTHGLDNFDDVNALELLLCFALPRGDTNPLAHALLARFGSLNAVLEAKPEELRRVPGVGESAAALLTLLPALSRRYLLGKTPAAAPVHTAAQAGRTFVPYFMHQREEVVYALFLDARHAPLGSAVELARGVVNAAELSARRLVALALEKNASFVLLAHNHLSGVALPSAEDEASTRALRDALAPVGLQLLDHIVVAGCDYVSMKECGIL